MFGKPTTFKISDQIKVSRINTWNKFPHSNQELGDQGLRSQSLFCI